jgi:predicted nucleic acid-binding protein
VIILDTNVISELMRPQPHPAVFAWAAAQPRRTVYTTSVNKGEILFGIAVLPQGRRRNAIAAAAKSVFDEDFAGHVLPFDADAAIYFAELVASRRRAGRPIQTLDAQIAATALVFAADIATRDVSGFSGCGVNVINPWTAS